MEDKARWMAGTGANGQEEEEAREIKLNAEGKTRNAKESAEREFSRGSRQMQIVLE